MTRVADTWRALSFRTQIAISTMVLTALSMAAVTVGLQLVLHRSVDNNLDQLLEDRSDSVVAAVATASGTQLVVPDGVLDPGTVVYDSRGHLVAGMPPPRLVDDVARLSRVSSPEIDNLHEAYRLLARPFTAGPGVHGVVVVSEPLDPYEHSELYVMLASIVLGIFVVIAVGVISRWVTSRALAPVATMAERAQDWSEHDLGQRFELGEPTNEISALGGTLDGLLERVAMTIRAEQRLTSELAHELRTPLAAIQGSADLALLRGGLGEDARIDLEQISESSRSMAETITTLLDLARDPEAVQQSATCRLGDVVCAVAPLVPEEVELVDRTGSPDLRIAAPRDLVVRALSPVVENAVRHARSRVTLEAVRTRAHLDVRVGDDGGGVDPAVRDRLFTPGTSGPGGGTGLGLGIARRVARSVGGDVLVDEDPSADGGAIFVVRLPHL